MEEQSSPDCEDRHKVIRCPYWWKIKIGDGDALYGKFLTESAAQEVAFLLRREFRNGEYLAQARIADLEARLATAEGEVARLRDEAEDLRFHLGCESVTKDGYLTECEAASAVIADLEAKLATAEAEVVRLREPWQPIETAPKDGTRVLLWRRAIRDQPTPIMADGFWCETCWVWPYLLSEPTHWQPLLAPPNNPQ